MRVIGAYLGIYLRQLERLLANNDLGETRMIHIEKPALHIYVVPLPDGYHLALVQRHPALVARARASLDDAVEQLTRELFTEAAGRLARGVGITAHAGRTDKRPNDLLELAPETGLPERASKRELPRQAEAWAVHDPDGDHRARSAARSPARSTLDERTLEYLEEILIGADLGVDTSLELVERVQAGTPSASRRPSAAKLRKLLADEMAELLDEMPRAARASAAARMLTLVVGVNGVGKTTSIAKLARRRSEQGRAGDARPPPTPSAPPPSSSSPSGASGWGSR